MRYLVALVSVLALMASPLRVSARDGDEGTTVEQGGEQAASETALQLQLDDAGLELAPSPPRTPDGYTPEEMKLRVKRARTGLMVSGMSMLGGAVLLLAGGLEYADCAWSFGDCVVPPAAGPLMISGGILMAGGFVGLIASGILKRKRKRGRGSLQQAASAALRHIQWDLAQSRLLF